jgi:phage terminase small subunit
MSGPLKNARHEKFAQELAKGKSQVGAYAAAGYTEDRTAASRLSTNANVVARVAELKKRAAERIIVTVADIAQQLDEDREFARELDNASAAITATIGKARVLGLLEDKSKVDITTAGQPLGLGAFYGNLSNERPSED